MKKRGNLCKHGSAPMAVIGGMSVRMLSLTKLEAITEQVNTIRDARFSAVHHYCKMCERSHARGDHGFE